jgi:hypothetical protein
MTRHPFFKLIFVGECVALCNKCADHARQSVSLVCTAQVKQRRQLLRMIMLVSMSCVFYGFSYLLHYKIQIRPDIESFHISQEHTTLYANCWHSVC